jgi:hypothetical protein
MQSEIKCYASSVMQPEIKVPEREHARRTIIFRDKAEFFNLSLVMLAGMSLYQGCELAVLLSQQIIERDARLVMVSLHLLANLVDGLVEFGV